MAISWIPIPCSPLLRQHRCRAFIPAVGVFKSLRKVVNHLGPPALARNFRSRRATPPPLEQLHRFAGDPPLWAARQVGGDVDADQFTPAEEGMDFVRANLPTTAEVRHA